MTTDDFFGNPAITAYLSGAVTNENIVRPVIHILDHISLDGLEKIAHCFSPNSDGLTLQMRCLKETVEQAICRKKGEPVVV